MKDLTNPLPQKIDDIEYNLFEQLKNQSVHSDCFIQGIINTSTKTHLN